MQHGDTSPITLTSSFACSPEAAWAAITAADSMAIWWGDYVHLEAKPGGAFREVWRNEAGQEVVTAGRIVAIEAPGLLRLTWKDDGWPVETGVTWQITPNSDGTHVALTHAGWDLFPAAQGPALRQAHQDGWRHHLGNLRSYLEAPPA